MSRRGRRHWQGGARSKALLGTQCRLGRAGSCHSGTNLKSAFTISVRPRYGDTVMLILAAAIAVSAPPAPPRNPVAAMIEARATVRILSGARVHLGRAEEPDGWTRRDTVIRSAGAVERATLIEFE
jgi:hypothetical protein